MKTEPDPQCSTFHRITLHSRDIEQNGCLVLKKGAERNAGWCVRFRVYNPSSGVLTNHSISLGQKQELLELVAELIATGRERRRKHIEKRKREQAKRSLRQHAEVRIIDELSQSRRHRTILRRAFRHYWDTCGDPTPERFMEMATHGMVPRPRPGRPLKNRLW